MKKNQQKIYGEQSVATTIPPMSEDAVKSKKTSHKWIGQINKFLAVNRGFLTVGALFAIWGTAGEVLLAHEWKLSTFLGKRGGNIHSQEITTSINAEATKQEVVVATGGAVELKKNCQQLRNQLGQNAFAQCIATNGTKPVCEYKLLQAQQQPCDSFTPETLVDDYQTKKTEGAPK